MAVTDKQRVKINAALSMIHSQGYDAQTVVNWAKEYQGKGYDQRRAYEQALNEFIGGQPELAAPLGKITRLVEASDAPTVSQYDQALSTYIQTGDDSALTALAPMIARDSVALAVKQGELTAPDINGDSVEAALGIDMADTFVAAAAQPASPTPPRVVAFNHNSKSEVALADTNPGRNIDTHASQVSPFTTGYVSSKSAQKFANTYSQASLGPSRTVTEGRVVAPFADGVTGEGTHGL
jgi:hypothetical protein